MSESSETAKKATMGALRWTGEHAGPICYAGAVVSTAIHGALNGGNLYTDLNFHLTSSIMAGIATFGIEIYRGRGGEAKFFDVTGKPVLRALCYGAAAGTIYNGDGDIPVIPAILLAGTAIVPMIRNHRSPISILRAGTMAILGGPVATASGLFEELSNRDPSK